MGERKLAQKKVQNNEVKQVIVSEHLQHGGVKRNFPNERESEFVFAGGYSEERTEEEIQNEDQFFDISEQAQIDDPFLIQQFEHDCSLHQDNKIDMTSSEEDK